MVAREELAVAKKELDAKKVRYAELMEESVEVATKVMLKVRAGLYREYREGKAPR